VSQQAAAVETLFLHADGDSYRVIALRDNERVFHGTLECKETHAGPRPGKFRTKTGSSEEPRDPQEFVDIARAATRIRISQQTATAGRQELQELLDGYQLSAKVVRTCRYCANDGAYSPITEETAIKTDREHICPDCAREELERELAYKGQFTGQAQERLEDLLLEVQDLDRIVDLLSGELDPDLTKFDTISATVDDVDPVQTADLGLHPQLQSMIESRFDELLPVQSLSVRNGLFDDAERSSANNADGQRPQADGDDQLVVSATATGKTLIGELAGINRALNGEGTMLFLVPLVALANQKHEDFRDRYGQLGLDVTIRVGASRINDDGTRFDPGADVIVGTYEGIDHALRTGKDLGDIGTVVIDEVHTLKEPERGHRLDGLISRLKYYCAERADTRNDYRGAQWLYLSATVGNPEWLAKRLGATLIEFEERPVPIERHVTFADEREKLRLEDKLVKPSIRNPRRATVGRRSSSPTRGDAVIRSAENWGTIPHRITPASTTKSANRSKASSSIKTCQRSSPPPRWPPASTSRPHR